MGTTDLIEVRYWERFLEVIHRSLSIDRHIDFFVWLKADVAQVLPHEALLAVWGDFEAGLLSYDLTSSAPGIRTHRINDPPALDALMRNLYQRWLESDQRCFALNDFQLSGADDGSSDCCMSQLKRMKSVLVHGIPDRRGKDDCLYIFFEKKEWVAPSSDIAELLLPHLDAALRRIECLAPLVADKRFELKRLGGDITYRESEIMKWVKAGKTNHEIGMILRISPNTVKNHLKNIFHKLDVSSRAHAVAKYEVHQTAVLPVWAGPPGSSGSCHEPCAEDEPL